MYHKLGGLEEQKFTLSYLERTSAPSEDSKGRILPCLFLTSGSCLPSLVLSSSQLHHSKFCLCPPMLFSLYFSMSKFPFSYKDTSHWAAAAAAAKSLQSCLTLCDPIDGSPPGSPVPGILQQEHWSGLPFPSPVHESESEVTQSCPTPRDPMDCSLPGSSIHGFSRQENWHGVPLPSS